MFLILKSFFSIRNPEAIFSNGITIVGSLYATEIKKALTFFLFALEKE